MQRPIVGAEREAVRRGGIFAAEAPDSVDGDLDAYDRKADAATPSVAQFIACAP